MDKPDWWGQTFRTTLGIQYYVDRWIAHLEASADGPSDKTILRYESLMDRFASRWGAAWLRGEGVIEWVESLEELQPATKQTFRTVISTFYSWVRGEFPNDTRAQALQVPYHRFGHRQRGRPPKRRRGVL